METNTGLTILGAAIGSAKLVEKVLGPTAEYIGAAVKNWTANRVNNVKRIFESAETKLHDKLNEEGRVHPKVLKGILSEGSFCDDELAAEYFGGVLASSRTNITRDDRGAYFVNLVSRLTSYQLRTHYVFYRAIRQLYSGKPNMLITPENRRQIIFIQLHKSRSQRRRPDLIHKTGASYIDAMGFCVKRLITRP